MDTQKNIIKTEDSFTIKFIKNKKTSPNFPRKNAEIKKKPL